MTIVRRPSSNNLAHAVIAQVLLVTCSENDGMYVCASVAFILLCTCVVAFSEKFTALISTQPLVGNQAYMPHIKAIYVPFHFSYDIW